MIIARVILVSFSGQTFKLSAKREELKPVVSWV